MTFRDRVYASIRRQSFDALPWQFDLTSKAAERLATYLGVADPYAAIGNHMIGMGDCGPKGWQPEPCAPGQRRDEFGAIWGASSRDRAIGDWGELISYPLQEPSLGNYRFPDGAAPGRFWYAPEMRAKYPDHFLVAGGHGLFEHGWALCGFENYLAYTAGEPAFIEALNEKLADFSVAVTAQLKGKGVDGICFGDDWGFQDRLMIPPATWRRLYKKAYRRIYDAARDAGLVVMIHSCGNIFDILPDLVDLGVEVVNPIQPEVMDVERCQRHFGRHLTFWGGLGSQSTIPLGTPADCRREAEARLRLFARGGYILGPAGAAPTETPPENIMAIVEVAKSQISPDKAKG